MADITPQGYEYPDKVTNPFWGSSPTPGGTTDYNDLENKPSINGVTLEGDLSLEDLGISQVTMYADLQDKPSINGVTLDGNKTTSQLGINTLEPLGEYIDNIYDIIDQIN